MAFKPNYGQQRNERKRSKESKKQEKLERRAAKRKEEEGEDGQPQETDTVGHGDADTAASDTAAPDKDEPAT